MLDQWRTTVRVRGPVHRDADGYLVRGPVHREIAGCLVAPGAAEVPGLLDAATSEAAVERAALYAPVGAVVAQGDTVEVPDGHGCAGTWTVESPPAVWPRGIVVQLVRR